MHLNRNERDQNQQEDHAFLKVQVAPSSNPHRLDGYNHDGIICEDL